MVQFSPGGLDRESPAAASRQSDRGRTERAGILLVGGRGCRRNRSGSGRTTPFHLPPASSTRGRLARAIACGRGLGTAPDPTPRGRDTSDTPPRPPQEAPEPGDPKPASAAALLDAFLAPPAGRPRGVE